MSGRKIGRYEIVRELGRGGMATVYLGFDPKLERQVAIKVLPSQFANDPEFFDRFEQEAKTLATLQHNSIVGLIDSGEDEGFPYFIMQLMNGGSLKDRITDNPPEAEEIITIFSRIAAALDKAHNSGIVHRDVKPSNVLFDEDGEAYLSDFGIVKLTQAEEGLTRTTGSVGTPHYMSPEQLDGVSDLDGRADIYALAVVLYEVLVGDPPYNHQSSPRIMVMHLNDPIPNILEKRPDLPPEINAIIKKGMAKDRNNRYAKASELAADLRSALAGWDPNAASTPEAGSIASEPAQAIVSEETPVEEAEVSKPAPTVPAAPQQAAQPTVSNTGDGGGNGNMPWIYALAGGGGVALLVLVVLGIMFFRNNGDDPTETTPSTELAVVEETDEPTEEPTVTPTETKEPTATNTATLAPVAITTKEPTATPVPTDTAEPTETAEPTVTEPPTETPTPEITLDDALNALSKRENLLQFSNLFESNQSTTASADENIKFNNDQLTLISNAKFSTIAFLPFEKSPDGYYETEVTFLDGDTKNGWAGIVLRVNDGGDRYYVFEINGIGQVRGARIGRTSDIVYVSASRLFDNAGQQIDTGIGGTNRLGIKISGNALEFFINGSNRGNFTFKDTFLTAGGVGLSSRVDDNGSTAEINFSYLQYE